MSDIKKINKHEERWGEKALSMGWTAIPASLFFLQNTLSISPIAFNVLMNLITHWWKTSEWPHPSQESIAIRMNVSVRTIQRGLSELEKKGLINKIKTSRDHPKYMGRNRYDLSPLVDALNTLTPIIKKKIEDK